MNTTEIHFHFEMDGFSIQNTRQIEDWLQRVIHTENKNVSVLNYIFCSDEYLLAINREYLDHDYYTDIISFPLNQDPVEGDIFISIDRVQENAVDFKTDFEQELHRVIVHGLLHFMGYNDHTEEEKNTMRQKEDEYLCMIESI